MPVVCPPQGWHTGIADSEYRRWRAWNQSILKLFGEWQNGTETMPQGSLVPAPFKTPAHALEQLMRPEPSTPDENFGTAYHRLLLEPARFIKTYIALSEKIDRRTAVGKAEWARLTDQYGEENILKLDAWEKLQGMAAAAVLNEIAKNLLGAVAEHEVSMTWRDERTGQMCKGRIDKRIITENGRHILVDPKTTKCPHWRLFEKDVARYGYHVQAAMYVDGYIAIHGIEPEYFIVAQEKTAPFCTVAYRVRPEVIESGRTVYRAQLELAKQCVAANRWPGYADGHVVEMDLPTWAVADSDPVT